MARARSPETAALEALVALVRARFGPDWRLSGASYRVEGPDGLVQTVRLDATAWLAGRATAAAEARHSPDFRSVHWFGTDYVFTPLQAHIIGQLWAAWEQGTPDVGGDRLVTEAGSETRELRHIFRGHPAWGALIITRQRGLYRLAVPE